MRLYGRDLPPAVVQRAIMMAILQNSFLHRASLIKAETEPLSNNRSRLSVEFLPPTPTLRHKDTA
jgi:hypothetical protein